MQSFISFKPLRLFYFPDKSLSYLPDIMYQHFPALPLLTALKNIKLKALHSEHLYFQGIWALKSYIYAISWNAPNSSLIVSSNTWQYKSIVICNELCPNNFCSVFGFIPFAIQFAANVCPYGIIRTNRKTPYYFCWWIIKYLTAHLQTIVVYDNVNEQNRCTTAWWGCGTAILFNCSLYVR